MSFITPILAMLAGALPNLKEDDRRYSAVTTSSTEQGRRKKKKPLGDAKGVVMKDGTRYLITSSGTYVRVDEKRTDKDLSGMAEHNNGRRRRTFTNMAAQFRRMALRAKLGV